MINKKYDHKLWGRRAWDADCPDCHGNGQTYHCVACSDTGLDPIPLPEVFAGTRRNHIPTLDEEGS